ncbi:MAG: LptA/OstA family protein [Alphaproteobacteria bacterium]
MTMIKILSFLLVLLTASTGVAQSLNFGSGDSDNPIEVFADDGIEWQQDKLIFLARGNARATRGEVTIYADELRAYYRQLPEGGTEIRQLDAIGNVRIVTPGETAFGDRGVYDVDNAILVISGSNARLVTANEIITARDQIEYWERKQMAVARGKAQVVQGDQKLSADILVAYFKKDKAGKSQVHRVEAFDNVRVKTGKDSATSQRGVYNVNSGIATLTGAVQIGRDGNKLDGCRAEINMNTGVSKLFGCGPGGSGQVGGVFRPGGRK